MSKKVEKLKTLQVDFLLATVLMASMTYAASYFVIEASTDLEIEMSALVGQMQLVK